jgi:hypothetical protein
VTQRAAIWPAVIIGSAIAAAVFAFAVPESPVRPFVVVWFVLVCPGMALVRMLRLADPLLELATGIALGIALELLVVVLALYSGVWSPRWILAGLVCFACGLAAADLVVVEPVRQRR